MGVYRTEQATETAAESRTAACPSRMRRPSRVRPKNPMGAPLGDRVLSAKYTDRETGLVYFGYRYYSPGMGRWISRDPLLEPGASILARSLAPASKNDVPGLTKGEREYVVSVELLAKRIDGGKVPMRVRHVDGSAAVKDFSRDMIYERMKPQARGMFVMIQPVSIRFNTGRVIEISQDKRLQFVRGERSVHELITDRHRRNTVLLYPFVTNNPIDFIDKLGLLSCFCPWDGHIIRNQCSDGVRCVGCSEWFCYAVEDDNFAYETACADLLSPNPN